MSSRPRSKVDDTDRRTHCFTGKMSWAPSCHMNPHVSTQEVPISWLLMIVNDARGTLKHVLSSLVEWRLVFAVICWNYARLGGAGKGPAGRSLLMANVFIRSRVMSDHIFLWEILRDQWDTYYRFMPYCRGRLFGQALRMTTADKNYRQTSKWLPRCSVLWALPSPSQTYTRARGPHMFTQRVVTAPLLRCHLCHRWWLKTSWSAGRKPLATNVTGASFLPHINVKAELKWLAWIW